MTDELADAAERNVRGILSAAIGITGGQRSVVVFDEGCGLARSLTLAYRRCLPQAKFLDFGSVPPRDILGALAELRSSDLAVLIQSTSFRLEAFRVRVDLFARGIKVVEHPHLSSMRGPLEERYYIDSLAYDAAYYRGTGAALKARLDRASTCVVDCGGDKLVFAGGLEPAKLNVGDYSGMKNTGGQFPIGEVFTEARDLVAVSGRVRVFAFGGRDFLVHRPERAATLAVEAGRVTGADNASPELEEVLSRIRQDEGEIWLRELGLGLNRAFSRDRVVSDIGTYERMCGVHLSLGAKHTIYKKPQFSRGMAKHHVDVFVAADQLLLDGEAVYSGASWRVG